MRYLIIALLTFIVPQITWAGDELERPKRTIKIASGSVVGVYYNLANAICQEIEKQSNDYNCVAVRTGGSEKNMQLLQDRNVDFAIIQSDILNKYYEPTNELEHNIPFKNLRNVFNLFDEAMAIMVRTDSDIRTISDLKGRKIYAGKLGSGSIFAYNRLMQSCDIDSCVSHLKFDIKNAGKALCNNNIDAVIFMGAHPNAFTHEVANSCDVKLLNISEANLYKVLQSSLYIASAIPGDFYMGVNEPVNTVGTSATMVTREDLEDEIVKLVVQVTLDDFEDIKQYHPVLASMDKNKLFVESKKIPLHDAVAEFRNNIAN